MFYELGIISTFNLFLCVVVTLGSGFALRDRSKTETMAASAFVVYLLLNGAANLSKRWGQALELVLMMVLPHLTQGQASQPPKAKAEVDAVADLLASVPRKRAPFPK
jgi:hypothetical protein